MCYEPLRFSPIFRRFVNSRESRVGSPLTPLNLTTKKRVTYTLSSFVLWCVLDRFTRSRAFPRTTPPSAYTNNKPLLFEPLSTTREKSSRLKSPLAGDFTQKPTPAQNRAVVCMQSLTPRYIGYPYAPVRLWRGCCRLVSSFVSMHVFPLSWCRGASLSLYTRALPVSPSSLLVSLFSLLVFFFSLRTRAKRV